MELEELALTKDEVKIYSESCFVMPIHPRLLEPTNTFDQNIAKEVFARTAQEWYSDLKAHTDSLPDDDEDKKWYQRVWLKEEPRIEVKYGHIQQMTPIHWRDDIHFHDNGFVTGFSISRDAGGSIYFNPGQSNPEFRDVISFDRGRRTWMPRQKAIQFKIPNTPNHEGGIVAHTFAHHNVDNYPGALFLRNWAINYMNEVFKQYPDIFLSEE